MEHSRHIVPSNFGSHRPSLDDSNGLSRTRQPLSNAAGNSQLQKLASVGFYHDNKGHHTRVDRPMYSMPTLPSQRARQPLSHTLEYRRQHPRKRRQQRHGRNPIVESTQYQAYRARQNREGNVDDVQKWPAVLEDAFLDALIEIPALGRRKFSYNGKPHGRNELIKEYLWIAYLQSLPPGTRPDASMQRTRKQVSSHIQVLKGFLRGHPAFHRLFPENRGPKNGFEDSFKNDPCLKALSEGRLPNRRFDQYDHLNELILANKDTPMRPTLFWLLITTVSIPEEPDARYSTEEDLSNSGYVAHKFSGLSAQRSRSNLDTIPNWPQKFPALDRLQMSGELNCDIMQMEVSLNLMSDHPPEGSELCCRTEISIPGRQLDKCEWRINTSFIKPMDLCFDHTKDLPLEAVECQVGVISSTDAETRIKVPFPVVQWANAFTQLINLQTRYEERRKAQSLGDDSGPPPKSVREYVDELSMYQEIRSSAGPRKPFIRRAIILWTFHKARHGEGNVTNWRYIDPLPPRRTCMSPSPHPRHHVSASMTESFNSWVDPTMNLQHPNMPGPFAQGLATPPHTAGFHSPYASQNFAFTGFSFDMASENLSFVSSKTADSDSTLVDSDVGSHMDHLLSNNNVHLGDYDPHSSNWHIPPTESFDADPAWASYSIPSSTPQIQWDADSKSHPWPEVPDAKPSSWVDETNSKYDWIHEATSSPSKQSNHIEQNIEQRLLPWIEHQDAAEESKNGYVVVTGPITTDIGFETVHEKDEWNDVDDEFGYAALAERLK